MTGTRGYDRARSISFDFDGVLSTLVLGRAWEKTRVRKRASPLVHSLKNLVASLTEGLRKPFPQAEDVLRQLRVSQRTLYVLTSRTAERITAAERWLDRYAWNDLFERVFYNADGEDADRFKARIIGSQGIDVHVDDDAEALAFLSRQFPEKLFVHMNCYGRRSPAGANIVVVHSWEELPALFSLRGIS